MDCYYFDFLFLHKGLQILKYRKKWLTNLDSLIKGSTLFWFSSFSLEHPKHLNQKLTFIESICFKLVQFHLFIDPNFTFSCLINEDHFFSQKEGPKLTEQSFQTDQCLLEQVKHPKKWNIIDISGGKCKFLKTNLKPSRECTTFTLSLRKKKLNIFDFSDGKLRLGSPSVQINHLFNLWNIDVDNSCDCLFVSVW